VEFLPSTTINRSDPIMGMPLLIDGYNLLYAAGIIARGVGPSTLERSRLALLNSLVTLLEPSECQRTSVIFDGRNAPPGLPRTFRHQGITVIFADKHSDADSLIEELILAESAPRQLTVVSGDHRLHRAARRRRAQVVDSDQWYGQLIARHRTTSTPGPSDAKPTVPLSATEVRRWLYEFSVEESEDSGVDGGADESWYPKID